MKQDIILKFQNLMDHTENFEKVLNFFEQSVKYSDTPVIEVGNRLGGSVLCFLSILKYYNKKNWFFGIDPYGCIPYIDGGGLNPKSSYSNEMYRSALKDISNFVFENKLNFCHFKLTSEDFMNFIYPNYIIYDEENNKKMDKFSFVYLDGSHDPEVVTKEIKFFLDKLVDKYGRMVVDDYHDTRFHNSLMNDLKIYQEHLVFKVSENKLYVEYKINL